MNIQISNIPNIFIENKLIITQVLTITSAYLLIGDVKCVYRSNAKP